MDEEPVERDGVAEHHPEFVFAHRGVGFRALAGKGFGGVPAEAEPRRLDGAGDGDGAAPAVEPVGNDDVDEPAERRGQGEGGAVERDFDRDDGGAAPGGLDGEEVVGGRADAQPQAAGCGILGQGDAQGGAGGSVEARGMPAREGAVDLDGARDGFPAGPDRAGIRGVSWGVAFRGLAA